MSDETFGQLIKKLREKQGWTLREAADKITEVTFPYLSQLEAGVAKPSENLARRIAKTYGAENSEEEKLVFLARGIPDQLKDMEEKFPRMMAQYRRTQRRPKDP